MENNISTDYSGVVKQIFVKEGDTVAANAVLIEIVKESEVVVEKAASTAVTGNAVNAPLPGRVISILVKVGDKVAVGQDVVILEAMKMENNVSTDYAGTVKQILVQEGDTVAADAKLVVVE
jgi:biotin carboxyl carrier protein